MELSERWQNMSDALTRFGLTAMQTSTEGHHPSKISGIAEYNGRNFEISLFEDERYRGYRGDIYPIFEFYMNVGPVTQTKRSVPYPEGLPVPSSITFSYGGRDLSPAVYRALQETGAKIIYPEEVSGITEGGAIRSLNQHILPELGKPFWRVFVPLQKPNEKHARCILPTNDDPKMFPYHEWQPEEGHSCIVDRGKGFPLLPIAIEKIRRTRIDLDMVFHGAEEERINHLLSGLRVPFSTWMRFGELSVPKNWYNILLRMHDNGYEQDTTRGQFKFSHVSQNLEDGILMLVPYFLKFYDGFTR